MGAKFAGQLPRVAQAFEQLQRAWPGQVGGEASAEGIVVRTPFRRPNGRLVQILLYVEDDPVVVCDMGETAEWFTSSDEDAGWWRGCTDRVVEVCMDAGCELVEFYIQCNVEDGVSVEAAMLRVCQASVQLSAMAFDEAAAATGQLSSG